MNKFLARVILLVMLLALAVPAYAQEAQEEVNTGQDFTKPMTRLDIRQKYQNLPAGKESYTTTFRVDKPIVLDGGWVLSTRADLPFTGSDVTSADNPDSDFKWGMSDFLTQFLLIAPQGKKSWTYAVGLQTIFPTASEDQMGTGRYQVAPVVGGKVDLNGISKGSFAYALIRNHFDAGGDSSRQKLNYLVIQPGINIALPEAFFVTFSPEMKVNWEDNNHWFIPFDVTVGKMLNKSTVVSLEYKTPIHDDKYRFYDTEIEARIGFFF